MDDPEYRAGQSHVQLALDDLDITRYPRHVSRESSKSVDHSCHKIEDHGNSTSESFDDSVKSPTRKHIAKVIILHLTVVPALICIMVIPYFTSRVASTLRAHPPASCSPDDIFRYKEPYDPWATSGTFKITLGFGSMSFSNVKLIDVIWVVVVGRGGRCQVYLSCIKDANLFQARGYSAVLRTRFSPGLWCSSWNRDQCHTEPMRLSHLPTQHSGLYG